MLEKERLEIDEIDNQLTMLFKKRMAVVERIAKDKLAHELPLTNPAREQNIIDIQQSKMDDPALSDYLAQWYLNLFELSKQHQTAVMKELKKL